MARGCADRGLAILQGRVGILAGRPTGTLAVNSGLDQNPTSRSNVATTRSAIRANGRRNRRNHTGHREQYGIGDC